jgi:polar amino acid transport system substrate-binding protein
MFKFKVKLGIILFISIFLFSSFLNAAETPFQTGILKVALNGDMPMTGLDDNGNLIGTDGSLMVHIATSLGLKVEPKLMDWSAEIQSTKQGKTDIMHGAMGWIEPRTKIMLLTDPIYYFGTGLTQKKNLNVNTFEGMKGKCVSTVSGFTLVPELKKVDGIGEVKLYDTTDGVMKDLISGRCDIAILDPPLIQLAINNNPDWNLHQLELKPQPSRYPIMSQKYNVIFGINKKLPWLYDAVNKEIAKIWASCLNVKSMAAYGLSDKSWFQPPPSESNIRIGVDRPTNWEAPSGDHCFLKR